MTEMLDDELTRAERLVVHLQGQSTALSQLPDPPAQQDVVAAGALVGELKQALGAAQAAAAQVAVLDGLPTVPVLADVAPLAALLKELTTAEAQAKSHRQSLQQAQADLDEAKAAIQTWAESNPLCPTCGAAIDPERLLVAGGHVHG